MLITILFICAHSRPDNRTFVSPAIDKKVEEVAAKIKDPIFRQTFINAFPNTLDTTIKHFDETIPDSFVITGDIDAMWLRDSTNQLWTYLPFVNEDPKLQTLFKGLIHRQVNSVLADPYANAFNYEQKTSEWARDNTTRSFLGVNVPAMSQFLHERKFEVDSLSAVLRLVVGYVKETNDVSVIDFNYLKALRKILETFTNMQQDSQENAESGIYHYTFQRVGRPSDTVVNGTGEPVKRTGMIRTFFRASDDSTVYQFNIPENAQAQAMLQQTAEMLLKADLPWILNFTAEPLIEQCLALAKEVKEAIYTHGVKDGHFLYEVDGRGNAVFMDDSNQPSLLSLPIYGFIDQNDPLYVKTRKMALSTQNPWYFVGTAASGIGGPHVGQDFIWPMAIVSQAMTTNDKEEIKQCLTWLVKTTGGNNKSNLGTNFMHESFHKNNPNQFTRSWFAWANGLFGELVLRVEREFPDLLEINY